MAKILITSGPTRQYLDPVRYLTNASSGRMGSALAASALARKHQVVIVSGPVEIDYPDEARLVYVTSTEEMLAAATEELTGVDGVIGVAAPCDYRPLRVAEQKITKTGQGLLLELEETPDIIASLGMQKGDRWVVGFALETEDARFRAITKAARKHCDLMVLNAPTAMNADSTEVELLTPAGELIGSYRGSKRDVADQIFAEIEHRLIGAGPASH